MHIHHPGMDPFRRKDFGRFQSEADGVAVGDNGYVFSFPQRFSFPDLKGVVLAVNYGNGVTGEAEVHRAVIRCRGPYQLTRGMVVGGHDDGHIGNGAQDAHILNGLVGGSVVGGSHAAVGAGDLYVQVRIGDLLPDHLTHAHGAEGRVCHHKGDLAAGGKAGSYTGAVLFGDTDIQVLLGESLAEISGFAAFADIRVDNKDIPVLPAENNDLITKSVAGRNLFLGIHLYDLLIRHTELPVLPSPACTGRHPEPRRASPAGFP